MSLTLPTKKWKNPRSLTVLWCFLLKWMLFCKFVCRGSKHTRMNSDMANLARAIEFHGLMIGARAYVQRQYALNSKGTYLYKNTPV